MGQHARLSPSSSERWLNCAGSVHAESLEPDEGDSPWSFEGTCAHKIFELCLEYGFDVADFLGRKFTHKEKGFEVIVDDEMVEFLQPIIDEIADMPGDAYFENRVNLSRWMPDQFGTLDVGIIQRKQNRIIIRDLKYGRGLPVRAEFNTQLMIYGAGFWDWAVKKGLIDKDAKPDFVIIIDQPRNEGGGGEWTVSFDDLMAFMDEVREKAAATYAEDAPRTAGDKQCGYCKAAQNGHCRTYDAFNLAKYAAKFDHYQGKGKGPELTEPKKLDPEIRAKILLQAPALKQWLARLHAEHINEIMRGGEGGGLKVVEGRKGNRKWKNEEAALEWMDSVLPEGVDLFQPAKVISPATAQKYLGKTGKAILEPHVDQADGKLQLVLEKDKRPAVKNRKEIFTEFDAEE